MIQAQVIQNAFKNMSETALKPGDLVKLKSGGPKMTVITSTAETTTCVWYNKVDNKFTNYQFSTVVLQKKKD